MIKKIKLILSITAITSISSLFGEVHFNLIFTDPNGIGFNDIKNTWMIEEGKKAAKLVGKVIDQNARVNIKVNATTETAYAWAPAGFYRMINEEQGVKVVLNARDKILNEKTRPDSQWDGHIEFNLSQFPNDRKDEFRRTFVHELTHTLGFLNFQKPTSKKLSFYNDYDKLLYDANGNPFLIRSKSKKCSVTNPKFNAKTELYACGESIRKHNNGKCVKIYNPEIVEEGSSFAHLDKGAHPRSIMSDRKCHDEYKIWNKYELGIMEDLGYKINWDNYYQVVRDLYPATVAVNIDVNGIDETNMGFEVIPNQDFPKDCFEANISKDSDNKMLSVSMNKECKLVLVDKKTKSHLYTLDTQKGDPVKRMHLGKTVYEVYCNKKETIRGETKIDIKFNKLTANS